MSSRKLEFYVNQFNTPTGRNLLPLTAGLLAAYAKNDPEVGSAFDIRIGRIRSDPADIVAGYRDPAVIAYSCYLWNMRHTMKVARLAKERFPRLLNIAGGPSIPRRAAEVAQFFKAHPFVDVIAFGEGEITLTEILRAFMRGDDFDDVLGIAFRRNDAPGGCVHTLPRPRNTDLAGLPSPFLDGTFDELLCEHPLGDGGVIIETNRGCPFSCSFCDWGQATRSVVNEFPIERVKAELDWISKNKIAYVSSGDANFGIKKRDLEIAQYFASLRRSTGYPNTFVLNWVKNSHSKVIDIAETLIDANVATQVTLSRQSFDDKVLEAIRRKNIHLDEFAKLKQACDLRNVPTYSEVILGLPEETYDSFCDGVLRTLSGFPKDRFNIHICLLLENADLSDPEQRKRYQIETRICEFGLTRRSFDSSSVPELEEVVVATSTLPHEDWKKAFEFGYLLCAFYNLCLANVVIDYLRHSVGVSLKSYVEFIREYASEREPQILELVNTLHQYQDAIMSGSKKVLSDPMFGDRMWNPDELCYLRANKDPDGFFSQLENLTRRYLASTPGIEIDSDVIEELFRFQRLLTPIFGKSAAAVASFECDWLSYYENMPQGAANELEKRRTTIRFSPPPHLAGQGEPGSEKANVPLVNLWAEFAIGQLYAASFKGNPVCLISAEPNTRFEDSVPPDAVAGVAA